jgi:hypothetical protein
MLDALNIQFLSRPLAWIARLYLHWTQLPQFSAALSTALDLTRCKSELLLENASSVNRSSSSNAKSSNRT